MTENVPLVCVAMTSYRDDWKKLSRAVASILQQTLTDIECFVVFEPDDPNDVPLRATFPDPRLNVITMPVYSGKSICVNTALRSSKSRYIARMDGNDYCHPNRLERQVTYLREHPDVGIVGTAARLTDTRGQVIAVRRFPQRHTDIVRAMVLMIPLLQPSVMWDRERVGFELEYDPRALKVVEDAELWFRLLRQGVRFANMPEPLVDYEPPPGYKRNKQNWRGNFQVRRQHWRVCLRYPFLFVGLILVGILAIMPSWVVGFLTGRNWLTDRLRSIRKPSRNLG